MNRIRSFLMILKNIAARKQVKIKDESTVPTGHQKNVGLWISFICFLYRRTLFVFVWYEERVHLESVLRENNMLFLKNKPSEKKNMFKQKKVTKNLRWVGGIVLELEALLCPLLEKYSSLASSG